MRRISAIIIILCLVYFIGGWVAVFLGFFEKNEYSLYAGIVGGMASVAGLFSFTRPSISTTDIQSIELQSLMSAAKTSEELEKLKKQRTLATEEINSLEVQKKEMELLVRKASLSLFLTEQCDYYEKQISNKLERDEALKSQLANYNDARAKLLVLEEEIKIHPNSDLLSEIVETARVKNSMSQRNDLGAYIDELPPMFKLFAVIMKELSQSLNTIIKTIFKGV